MFSHDDFGSKSSLLMAPKSGEPNAEDLAEISADIWQGVLPNNDEEIGGEVKKACSDRYNRERFGI